MHRMRKLIHSTHSLHLVSSITKNPQISGQGGAITTDIDDAARLHPQYGIQTDTVAAFPGRVHQSFYQVNPIQTEKLYSLALEYAGLTGRETVWDLYCGIGTISLFLASGAGQVCGVEIVPQAIEDAKENARRNGIHNARFFVGKAEEVLPAFYEGKQEEVSVSDGNGSEDLRHPDVIVVDPPRKGCDGVCLDTILRMQLSL